MAKPSRKKHTVVYPHEFRVFMNGSTPQLVHYVDGKNNGPLPIFIDDKSTPKQLAGQVAKVLNDVFKFGIRYGYEFAKNEGKE